MDDKIGASVGSSSVNRPHDVMIVQQLLKRHERWLSPLSAPPPSGNIDAQTERAIRIFQESGAALAHGDGVVSPSGYTIKALERVIIPGPKHRVFTPVCWARGDSSVTAQDYAKAAKDLGCEVAAIQAVAMTETEVTSTWDKEGRPTILFERHKFRKHTKGAYNRSHPDISGPQGAYGKFSAQYPKLRRAAMLDENAALQSASWGSYQIMGENYKLCGFASVDAFVDAMLENDLRQLQAFVTFMLSSEKKAALAAFRKHDWTTFARIYNGPDYAKNQYDTKIAEHFKALSPPVLKK